MEHEGTNVSKLPERNKELIEMLKGYTERAEKGEITRGVLVMFTAESYELATSNGGNVFLDGGALVAIGLQKMGFVTQNMLQRAPR